MLKCGRAPSSHAKRNSNNLEKYENKWQSGNKSDTKSSDIWHRRNLGNSDFWPVPAWQRHSDKDVGKFYDCRCVAKDC